MHKITFYPIGNADCCMIDLESGKKLLFDFAHYDIMEDEDDKRIDLAKAIKENLEESDRNDFDVVAFSHLDNDHIAGFGDNFYLEYNSDCQDDDRIRIQELWVPAAVILETSIKDNARILRQEARHRLINGNGIRVFSGPKLLDDWLKSKGIDPSSRKDLIFDAGKTIDIDGIEFFIHSPFAQHDGDTIINRNEDSLIFHITFLCGGQETKFFYVGDTTYEILADIVNITKYHNREDRLEWDIFDIPHHCSYRALNEEKGLSKTEPIDEVRWLLEQGNEHGILVSCSNPIPRVDDDLPPHRQAAECYKEYAEDIDGEFIVTMEFPKDDRPKPLVIEIDNSGATPNKEITPARHSIITRPAPRAGGSLG